MRDSDTYMAILDEGREKGLVEGSVAEAKKLILRLGLKPLGAPDENVKNSLAAINDLERLEFLVERIFEVKTWQELLGAL